MLCSQAFLQCILYLLVFKSGLVPPPCHTPHFHFLNKNAHCLTNSHDQALKSHDGQKTFIRDREKNPSNFNERVNLTLTPDIGSLKQRKKILLKSDLHMMLKSKLNLVNLFFKRLKHSFWQFSTLVLCLILISSQRDQ